MARGERPGRDRRPHRRPHRRHGRAGEVIAGLAMLGVLLSTGGVDRFTTRLADLVPGDEVAEVLQHARSGDVGRTTDAVARVVNRMATGAAEVAGEVADGAGRPEEGVCPLPAAGAPAAVDVVRDAGHTDARHVGRTDAQLLTRLAGRHPPRAASTFPDRATAARAITAVLGCTADARAAWLAGTDPGLRCRVELADPVGRTIRRGSTQPEPAAGVEVHLVRTEGPAGMRIATAFPDVDVWGTRCGAWRPR